MRLLARGIILLFLSLTFPITVRAAFVTNSELPGTIQACVTAATCVVSNASSYDSGTASAFQIYQNIGSSWESNWLMRYTLAPPSNGSGYLWMLAKNTYSASETAHPFTLYLDKVTPASSYQDSNQNGGLDLFMSTADVVAGSAYQTYGLDYDNNSYDYGDLSGEVPLPCLAEGCESSARLNLVQLTYGSFGSAGIWLISFNPADTRALVYTQRIYSPCYADPYCGGELQSSFYINAVPLPGAVWLFGSGLAGLIGVMRRVRRR